MQSRLELGRGPRSELVEAASVAGAHQLHIALLDGDPLLPLGRFEVLSEDMLGASRA